MQLLKFEQRMSQHMTFNMHIFRLSSLIFPVYLEMIRIDNDRLN